MSDADRESEDEPGQPPPVCPTYMFLKFMAGLILNVATVAYMVATPTTEHLRQVPQDMPAPRHANSATTVASPSRIAQPADIDESNDSLCLDHLRIFILNMLLLGMLFVVCDVLLCWPHVISWLIEIAIVVFVLLSIAYVLFLILQEILSCRVILPGAFFPNL